MSSPSVTDFLKLMGHEPAGVSASVPDSSRKRKTPEVSSFMSTGMPVSSIGKRIIQIPEEPLELGFKYVQFSGWCCDDSNHNKVWAVLTKNREGTGDLMTVWGSKYGKLNHKVVKASNVGKLIATKKKYTKIFELVKAFANSDYINVY